MEYNVFGKQIVGMTGWGNDEFTLEFDDGVRLVVKAVADVGLSRGKLEVSATIEISTRKVKLKAEDED